MKTNILQKLGKALATAALSLSFLNGMAQAPVKVWDKRYGGTAIDSPSDIEPAPGGGYVMLGWSQSGADGNKTVASRGGNDFWVVKIDVNGNKVWDKRFGSTGSDVAYDMVAAPGGGYVLAGVTEGGQNGDISQTSRGSQDYWIVKIDENGNKVWDKRFGGASYDLCSSIAVTPTGGYLLGGYSGSGITGDKTEASRGYSDFWFVKIDANGNKIWDKRFGSSDYDNLTSVIAAPGGGYVAVGDVSATASGDLTGASRGLYDQWIIKFDENGNKVWDKRYGTNNSDYCNSIVPAFGGGFITGGRSNGGINQDKTENNRGIFDWWFMKIDDNGDKVWDKRFGGDQHEGLSRVIACQDGGYLGIGGIQGTAGIFGDITKAALGGGNDCLLIKIDENGNKLWDGRYGGAGSDGAVSALSLNEGHFIVLGASSSGIGGDKSENAWDTNGDYWVLEIAPPANAAPTDLALTANTIAENNAVNTVIGTLSTTDPDAGNTFTYSISGTDAASFNINGAELRASEAFDYETKNSYSITIRTTDQGGLFFEEDVTISVTDVNETPTDLALTANAIAENNAVNEVIGTLSTTDPDAGNTFTYSISGTDAASFNINGAELRASEAFDFETKNSYSIIIRTTDQGGLFFEKPITINITDVVEGFSGNFAFNTASISVPEGNSGYVDYTFEVGLTGATTFPASVEVLLSSAANVSYNVPNSNTFGRDYSSLPWYGNQTLPFTFNDNGVQTFKIRVFGDAVTEESVAEVVTMTLQNVVNSNIDAGNAVRTVTINDDDANTAIATFTATDMAVNEGNSGTLTYSFAVSLTGVTSYPVTVPIAVGGTANYMVTTSTGDYKVNPAGGSGVSTLSFTTPGTKNISVVVYGDTRIEGNETVTLTILPSAAYTVGATPSVTLTIQDEVGGRTGKTETENGFALYPNPNAGQFNLSFETVEGTAQIRLFNLNGMEVLNQTVATVAGLNRVALDATHLPAGVYSLTTNINGEIKTAKMVKE